MIGARREVYRASQLVRNAKPAWYDEAPRRLDPQQPMRQPDELYHFLLPDPGMANYTDKVARKLYAADFERLKQWRKECSDPLDLDQQLTGVQWVQEGRSHGTSSQVHP